MVQLSDIFDPAALRDRIEQGYVTERRHPEFPELAIYNYSDKTAFDRVWDEVTLNTRGLIVNTNNGEVLARPFKKFFNLYEQGAPILLPETKIDAVTDKLDGSLGIIYRRPDSVLAVATRGSFESDQAIHATEWINNRLGVEIYAWASYEIAIKSTPLVEIIYPANRIVVDYADRDELVPLGVTYVDDGQYYPYGGWDAQRKTLAEVLAEEPRPNAEGYVLWLNPHSAVKVKQQDYIELHRIVTGLNRKSIWRALKEGPDEYAAIAAQLPDELYAWAEQVKDELYAEYAAAVQTIDNYYYQVCHAADRIMGIGRLGEEWDRGKFARIVKELVPGNLQGYMFTQLDGRDIRDKVWATLEPKGAGR